MRTVAECVSIWADSDNGSTVALQASGRGSIPRRSTIRNNMLKFIAQRRFSYFDLVLITTTIALVEKGMYWSAAALFVASTVASSFLEYLTHKS